MRKMRPVDEQMRHKVMAFKNPYYHSKVCYTFVPKMRCRRRAHALPFEAMVGAAYSFRLCIRSCVFELVGAHLRLWVES